VTTPSRKGFGQIVIGRMAAAAVEGTAEIIFEEKGISWQLNGPVENVLVLSGAISGQGHLVDQ
jgi:hypothetical protein